MAKEKHFLGEANRLVNAFYRMSGELQVLACVAVWAHIAILLRLVHLDSGLPSVWEAWIGFLVLLVGLLSGPLVATISALVCAALLSPAGLYAETAGGWVVFTTRLSLLLLAGLVGGFLKRLVVWLNEALYRAEHHVEGTELPNLKATLAHIEELLKSRPQEGEALDVLNVRLKNLDEIRRTAGQEKLDRVLSTFAGRLRETLGEGAWVGQLAGDELLGVQVAGGRETKEVQRLIDAVLERPVDVDGESYNLQASSGVHRSDQKAGEVTPQQLLDEATRAAARQTESRGPRHRGGAHNAYQDDLGQLVSSRQLQAAMENGEITLLYVPRLNSRSGYFSTLEATICWRHPQRGMLSLDEFRPMLEEESAIQGLALWAVRLGLADADEWLENGRRFRLALDVSIDDHVSAPVLAYLLKALEQRDSSSGWLSIELGEKALTRADDKTLQYLVHLQRKGVSVAVTGFGITGGGATVQEMLRLPVDTVKLSMKNVDRAAAYSDERRQLNALVRMIHARGLATVAEEIRNRELLRVLRSLNVQELQGPVLSRPLAKEDIPWGRIR